MEGRKTMATTIKWTWGKYNGLFKDKTVKNFDEIWTYEKPNDEQWKAMEARALELLKNGYFPEKTEYVEVK